MKRKLKKDWFERYPLVIKNKQEYREAMGDLSDLMEIDPPRSSPQGRWMLQMAQALEAYEKKRGYGKRA